MPPDPPRGQAIRTQQLLLNSMQLLLSKVVKTLHKRGNSNFYDYMNYQDIVPVLSAEAEG